MNSLELETETYRQGGERPEEVFWTCSRGKGGFRTLSSPQGQTLTKPFRLSVILHRREKKQREKKERRKNLAGMVGEYLGG